MDFQKNYQYHFQTMSQDSFLIEYFFIPINVYILGKKLPGFLVDHHYAHTYSSSVKSIKLSMAQMDKDGTIKEKSLRNKKKINNQVLYKKITGFSSWGPGQLENEIKNGDWIPQQKQDNIIFSNNPESSWEDMIKSLGIDNIEIINQGAQA